MVLKVSKSIVLSNIESLMSIKGFGLGLELGLFAEMLRNPVNLEAIIVREIEMRIEGLTRRKRAARNNISRALTLLLISVAAIWLAGCEKTAEDKDEAGKEVSELRSSPSAPIYDRPADITLTTFLTVGEEFTLTGLTPMFIVQPAVDGSNMRVYQYEKPGEVYTVTELQGEWAAIKNSNKGENWMPAWYAGNGMQEAKSIPLTKLVLKDQVKLSLFPMSEWKHGEAVDDEPLYSLIKWKDWYGVPRASEHWYDENWIYKPALLWVKESDVADVLPIAGGAWDEESGVAKSSIRQVAGVALLEGTGQAEVETLLGKPSFTETSRSLNMTGEPLDTGVIWRYEAEECQFVITFDAEGKLVSSKWILPAVNELPPPPNLSYSIEANVYEFRNAEIPATAELNWTWRNKGTLAYSYLEHAIDDVLLIRGDDGGFSGMHYDSNLYALNRKTGEKLWQIDAGFGWMTVFTDEDQKHVTLFNAYDPAAQAYRNQIRRVRLADGEIIWSKEIDSEDQWIGITGAKGVVLVYKEPFESAEGAMSAFNAYTGELLWEKPYGDHPYLYHNVSGEEPYLLLEQNKVLYAVHPQNGKVKWKVQAKAQNQDEEHFPDFNKISPFAAAADPNRWFKLGGELLSIEISTGKVLTRYVMKNNEKVTILNNRYLLINAANDAEQYYIGEHFDTIFYDTKLEKELWRLPGKAFKAIIDGDIIYLDNNGSPLAVDKETGSIKWRSASSDSEDQLVYSSVLSADPLLYAAGESLIMLDKNTGAVVGRVNDVLLGYPDGREPFTKNGLLNRAGDSLYLGSANGYFSRYAISDFELK